MSNTDSLNILLSYFDEGCFDEIDRYAKSGDDDVNVVCGFGTVGGVSAYAYIQNGALDSAACKKIKKVYALAEKTGCPIISVFNSNGVKLDEGFGVLNEYSEIVKCSSRLSGVILQIAVVNGDCLGVMSVCANLADVVIAVKGSDFSVTVPSEATADDNFKAGVVDYLAEDNEEAGAVLCDIISLIPSNNLSETPYFEFDEPVIQGVPAKDDIIPIISDEQISVEFKGGYAPFVKTVLTTVNGRAAGIICFSNELCKSCAYKAEAFIKLCDAYSIPVITVANTRGIKKDNEPETLIALTKLASAYAGATCPKISLITSEAFAGGYVLLAGKGANADITFAWDSAVISPMSTESAVAFLWNDRLAKGENRAELEEEYKTTLACAKTAAESGAVDDVFSPEDTKNKISLALDMLSGKRESTLARKHTVK